MTCFLKLFPCIFILVISACQVLPDIDKKQDQGTPLILKDHVLSDRVYDVDNKKFIDKPELLNRISSSKYILLGETHDNISHHRNQAWVIDNLARQHVSASAYFEMIDDVQSESIVNKNIKTADELIKLLNNHKSGWEYEIYYKGLFESVLKAGFVFHAANIERQKLRSIIKQNNNLLPIETEKLLSEVSLTHEMEHSLQEDIIDSHCGMIGEEAAKSIMLGQRIRDATMALSLLNSSADKNVLIAGSGHVRKDRGVPIYLAKRDKDVKSTVISMLEVEQDKVDLASYLARWNTKDFPSDYVWFTARADREDPCLHFKQQ